MELRADLDQIEALAGERDALWARLQSVSFLTDDEKRAAAGYGVKEGGPQGQGPFDAATKYRPE